jgi:prevent-host-death family protein
MHDLEQIAADGGRELVECAVPGAPVGQHRRFRACRRRQRAGCQQDGIRHGGASYLLLALGTTSLVQIPQRLRRQLESSRRVDYNDYLDHIIRGATMSADTWTVAEAKAKFSEVIDRAQSNGPQIVTRSGRKSVVVVSAEEWERKVKRVGNLAEFFASSPLRGSRLRVKRSKDGPRKVDL